MNWDAIAAVGELLGASAVLVTLIYLAVQIRQNTSAVATATYESTMTGFNDINIVVAGGRVGHLRQRSSPVSGTAGLQTFLRPECPVCGSLYRAG